MGYLRYNTGVNHIKSDGLFQQHRHPFSTYVKGIDTMTHSNSQPTEQSNIPYGYCHCGCGQLTTISKVTDRRAGTVKGEPVRYVLGHANKLPHLSSPNPTGLCLCGCGQPAPIAKEHRRERGHVKGQPISYIPGHHMICGPIPEPNPSGLCMCGCGQMTPIARRNSTNDGFVKGKHVRYIIGHHMVKNRELPDDLILAPGTKAIPLTQGKYAIVDEADYEWLMQWRWFADDSGETFYVMRQETLIDGTQRKIRMHRFILDAPKEYEVDHINGDGLNNTRANLRLASHTQNQHNKRVMRRNRSGYKGVYLFSKTAKWGATIKIDGKSTHLGTFDRPEDAARAYDKAAREHFGEFAWLNFPEEQ
jgi:hypothetical protein